MLDDDKLVWET